MIVCEFCGDEDNGEFIHENGFDWCQICLDYIKKIDQKIDSKSSNHKMKREEVKRKFENNFVRNNNNIIYPKNN